MRAAPRLAKDDQVAQGPPRALADTERHERLVRERLVAYWAKPSGLKDVVMKAGGVDLVLFAGSQPPRRASSSPTPYSWSTSSSPLTNRWSAQSMQLLELAPRQRPRRGPLPGHRNLG